MSSTIASPRSDAEDQRLVALGSAHFQHVAVGFPTGRDHAQEFQGFAATFAVVVPVLVIMAMIVVALRHAVVVARRVVAAGRLVMGQRRQRAGEGGGGQYGGQKGFADVHGLGSFNRVTAIGTGRFNTVAGGSIGRRSLESTAVGAYKDVKP